MKSSQKNNSALFNRGMIDATTDERASVKLVHSKHGWLSSMKKYGILATGTLAFFAMNVSGVNAYADAQQPATEQATEQTSKSAPASIDAKADTAVSEDYQTDSKSVVNEQPVVEQGTNSTSSDTKSDNGTASTDAATYNAKAQPASINQEQTVSNQPDKVAQNEDPAKTEIAPVNDAKPQGSDNTSKVEVQPTPLKAETTSASSSSAVKADVTSASGKQSVAQIATNVSKNSAIVTTKFAQNYGRKVLASSVTNTGFSVSDPDYPSGMWIDPDNSHYSYEWLQAKHVGKYGGNQIVFSTNRTGDGIVYVTELSASNDILEQYTLNQNDYATSHVFDCTYYNDVYFEMVQSSSNSFVTKYTASEFDNNYYATLTCFVPKLITQTTYYVDKDGKQITDSNGNPVAAYTQKGLDGQNYTTSDVNVINGYYATAPANSNGVMSPYGKIGASYVKNYHDGVVITYTQTGSDGTMSASIAKNGRVLGTWTSIKPSDPTIMASLGVGDNGVVFTYTQTGSDGTMSALIAKNGRVLRRWPSIKPSDLTGLLSDLAGLLGDTTYGIANPYIPQTFDIKYVYNKLGNWIVFNPDGSTTSRIYPNDPSNPTKIADSSAPDYPVIAFIPGYTPEDYMGTPLVPVDPDDRTKGYIPPTPYDIGTDTKITYTADEQKGSVSYVDDTTGKTLKTDSILGTTGSKSSYSTSGSIADYKKQGYELVTDGYPADLTFDNDDTTDQNFTVHLKHQLTPVNPTNPQTPGASINPDDPDSPKWPISTNYDKTVNETVSYVDQNGHVVAKKHTDSVNFTRTVVVDNVTGEVITSGAGTTVWTATNGDTTFDAVAVPVVSGSVANKAKTAAVTDLNADSADVNETVTYTKVGSLVPSSSDKNFPGAPTVAYSNDPSDATKVKPAGVPTVPGYTAHDPEGHVLTPGSSYQPSDPTKDTTITYTADKQKGSVSYVDDTTGKTLKTDSISGTTGSKSSYSTSGSIADYKKQGYELVTDGYPADLTFDNNDTTDQNFTVHLKHQLTSVNPTNPQTPGKPVDPNNPDGPKYPDGTAESDLVKTINRTIHYKYANGKKVAPDVVETTTFKRNASFDQVTGKVTYTNWNEPSHLFDKVASPAIKGYTPNVNTVSSLTVKPDSKVDSNVTVVYNADAEKAHVKYVDSNQNDKVLKNDVLSGRYGEKSDYSIQSSIAGLDKQGYELVTNNYPAGYVFGTDEPTYTVTLKHKVTDVTPNKPGQPNQPVDPNNPDGPKYPDGTAESDLVKTVTRTIHYQYDNGKKVAPDAIETTTFKRNASFDQVTGKVTYTNWNEASHLFDKVDSPVIKGYTPNVNNVSSLTVNPDSKDSNVTVIYNADAEKAHVKYVDSNQNDKVLKNDVLSGRYGEKSDYSIQSSIAGLDKQGYELVTNNYPAGYVFGTDEPTYTVTLKHKVTDVTPNKPGQPNQPVDPNNPDGPKYPDGTAESDLVKTVTRTIHYQYDNGKKVAPDAIETTTFKRNASFDQVTGKVTYTNWNEASHLFDKVDSPVIKGYTPNVNNVSSLTVNPDSKDSNVTVIYNADAEKVHVKYVDKDQNNKVLKNDDLNGVYGKKSDYSTQSTIANLDKQGYELVTNNYPAGHVFDTDEPTYTVVLKHKVNNGAVNSPELPQTGENNSQSQTMSFIGILLAMFGSLLGFLGIKKRRND
ncbi:mucin-binding protein [Fructilactobacillus sanfranciscensis]|nr:LPXTG cell wall anchor domain-containing protein [Fructilactobacillus sanfranciscensis]